MPMMMRINTPSALNLKKASQDQEEESESNEPQSLEEVREMCAA